MKKIILFIISTIIILAIIFGIYYFFNKNYNTSQNSVTNNNENVTADNSKNILNEIANTNIVNNNDILNTISNSTIHSNKTEEKEVATFSTSLKGDSARLNNINITCNTINGTTVNNGETFSFNKIIGMPSKEKGYQEADIFVAKKTEKGYGGGNCQVSTTIYNTALKVQGILITERHPHQKRVTYIEEGKDAAVSYSSGLDLKFQNNTGKTLKIYASSDEDSVDVRITEI